MAEALAKSRLFGLQTPEQALALGFLNATAMRFARHLAVGGVLFAVCLAFVAVGVRRINRMTL